MVLSFLIKPTLRLGTALVLLLLCFNDSAFCASSSTAELVGGKPVNVWLARAAEYALPGKGPDKGAGANALTGVQYDPIDSLNIVAQQQVLLGDVGGANKSIESMERYLDSHRNQAGIAFEADMIETMSAEISAGRISQAQKALNRLGEMNGAGYVGFPTELSPYVARIGQLNRALGIVTAEKNVNTRIRFYALIARAEYVLKHPKDGDVAIGLALKELSGLKEIEQTDAEPVYRLLALRGRCEEALDLIDKVRFLMPEIAWSELFNTLARARDEKSVHALAGLILARARQKPLTPSTPVFHLICTMAEIRATGEAKDLMQLLSGIDHTRHQTEWDQFIAEYSLWTHDPDLESALKRAGIVSGKPPGRRRMEDQDFFQRMAHAFAMNDDPTHALAMADQVVGALNALAMFDVMSCEARLGQSETAIAQLKKTPEGLAERAVECLAQGWALAKDTTGLPTWIDTLESIHLKYYACIGVVEGALHTKVRDPYRSD